VTVSCQSCGRDTEESELVVVHRAYFFDADDPDPDIVETPERWCASCCHTYPHVREEPIGPEPSPRVPPQPDNPSNFAPEQLDPPRFDRFSG
jgi:hypothetical protein